MLPSLFMSRPAHENSYRAMQLAHQASLRERKNLLQSAMRFQALMDDAQLSIREDFI